MSQDELAELVGTTGVTIGRYERGERPMTIAVLIQLAPHLGCRPADLLPDPESVLDDRARALLANFKALPAEHQQTLLDLTEALRLQVELREQAAEADAPPRRLLRHFN